MDPDKLWQYLIATDQVDEFLGKKEQESNQQEDKTKEDKEKEE